MEELFDFTFPVWSKKHDRAASGIVRSDTGRRIFGALWRVPSDLILRDNGRPGRETLDAIEGEGFNYTRQRIFVTGSLSHDRIDAITYLPTSSSWKSPTDSEYANHIITGLKEWRAPDDYVEYVRVIIARALKPPDPGKPN